MKTSLMWSLIILAGGLTACSHQLPAQAPESAATALTAYHWTLDRTLAASGTPDPRWMPKDNGIDTPPTLTFDEQGISVDGLCNMLRAAYETQGAALHISQVAGTLRMCQNPNLMRYEQRVGQYLPQASAWHITGAAGADARPNLTLRFDDGSQWVLTGAPTAETRYGSKGERMFLEIAPQTTVCSDPMIPERQCLKVRTITYNASGIKQAHGTWEPFYGYIDGYQHEPGVRQIVRVKRYTRQHIPADASAYAYVLDMIVESEQTTSQETP